ncbi:hypothetical protein CBR_g34515 [Chara braunii]|uniref:CCHC-type domain-containing protein n=1 Tax=Chara braunii TaxID=69332 RepID=A0A388LJ04_CHABU|nr:hypothetical protein CBR_g34515 [Chara braunii]|eukprot:GBG82231.1 hypothetical protein CBR_g34515 [Chara braunii]
MADSEIPKCYNCGEPGHLSRGCIKPWRPRDTNEQSAASTSASNANHQIVPVSGPGAIQAVERNDRDSNYRYGNGSGNYYNNNHSNNSSLTSNKDIADAVLMMREFCATFLQEKREEKERRKEEEEKRKREDEMRLLTEERESHEKAKQQRAEEREARLAMLIESKIPSKDQGYQVIIEQLADQNRVFREAVEAMKADTMKNPIIVKDIRRDVLLLREAELKRAKRKRGKEQVREEEEPAEKKTNGTLDREARLAQELLNMEMRHREEMKTMREEIERLKAAQAKALVEQTPSTSKARTYTPLSGLRTVRPEELFARSAPVGRTSTNQEKEPLGFDRLVPGKKAVVAEPGPDGQKKYIEETKRLLKTKNMPFLMKMAKDQKVKTKSNRKDDLIDALAEARAEIAYGKRRDDPPVRISEQINPDGREGRVPGLEKFMKSVTGWDKHEDAWFAEPEACVYALVSPRFRATYIGQTSRTLEERWEEHKRMAETKEEGRQHKLYRWLRKKGWREYVAIPLVNGAKNELLELEGFYIGNFCPVLNAKGRRTRHKKNRPGRRQRRAKNRQRTASDGVAPVLIESEGYKGYSIRRLLAVSGSNTIVRVGQGTRWCEDWSVVKRCYGMTEIRWRGEMTLLRRVRLREVIGSSFEVTRIVLTKNNHNHQLLIALLRIPLYRRTLYTVGFTMDRLVRLYYAVREFRQRRDRAILRGVISRAVRAKYGVSIRKRLIVRVRFEEGLSRYEVTRCCKKRVRETYESQEIAEFVCRRMKVVWTRDKTIGQLVCNHRRYARMELGEAECGCDRMEWPKDEEGHVCFRFSEVEKMDIDLKNSRNVPRPDYGNRRGLVRQVNRELSTFFGLQEVRLFSTKELEHCYKQLTGQRRGISMCEVQGIKEQTRGLVLMPMDHNMGDTMACCPIRYQEAMRTMFLENQAFVKHQEEEGVILHECKKLYVSGGYTRIAKWDNNGALGQAYVTPKHKDISRWRPICPSYGRALNVMLWSLPKLSNLNLKSTQQLVDCVMAINKNMGRTKRRGLIAASFDIKDMFSKLPHEAIIEAVEWLVERYEERGLSRVRVKTKGKGATFGKAGGKVGWVTMSFSIILKFVRYDLANTFLKAATKILQQREGIPMGKSSSAALACVLCAHCEYSFLNALGADRKLVHGCRLIDDVSVFISFQIDESESLAKAMQVMKEFEKCYDERLTLKRTDEAAGTWPFLGCKIRVSMYPPLVSCTATTANGPTLLKGGNIVFQGLQDFTSYSSMQAKKAVITGYLHRVWNHTLIKEQAGPTLLALKIEFRKRGFPGQFFDSRLAYFSQAKDGAWDDWAELLRDETDQNAEQRFLNWEWTHVPGPGVR